jgi:cytochrome P450
MTAMAIPAHVPPALVRDFDYLDMRGETDVYRHFGKLHDGPDIVWSPHYGGHWIATRYADMEHILSTPGDFSSRHQTIPINPVLVTLIESDGELHDDFRKLIQPSFSPKSVGALEDVAAELTTTLIDGFHSRGECDFAREFAQMMPIAIAMKLIGLPPEDRPYLLQIADDLVRPGDGDIQADVFGRVIRYFDGKIIPARKAKPGKDMVSAIITGRVEGGRPPTHEEVLGLCVLLIAGGLDTVTSMMGFIALFLARNPAHRRQLIDDPALIPKALEELMRRHHIANIARVVTRDLEHNGVLFRKGDLVLTPTSAAGIDERRFPDAMTVDFSRNDRKTLVFGRGPHQCVGAFLARTELRVFLARWLERIPHFEVKPGEQPIMAPGKANGCRYLPLTWQVG